MNIYWNMIINKYMSTTKEELIEHPLEEVFDIKAGSTLVEYEEKLPTVIEQPPAYDSKDVEIEEQYQEVYDCAMDAYENQMEETEGVEGRYKARNGEIAAQFLNTALHAAKEKANLKEHKDKIESNDPSSPNKVVNNLVLDRNELLKMLTGN